MDLTFSEILSYLVKTRALSQWLRGSDIIIVMYYFCLAYIILRAVIAKEAAIIPSLLIMLNQLFSVSPDNFTAQKMTLTFPPCTPSLCVNITINDDSTLEKEEVFNVLLDLDGGASEHNITLVKNKTMVVIMDNDGKNQYLYINYTIG